MELLARAVPLVLFSPDGPTPEAVEMLLTLSAELGLEAKLLANRTRSSEAHPRSDLCGSIGSQGRAKLRPSFAW